MEIILYLFAGIVVGAAIGYLFSQSRAGGAAAAAGERARAAEVERARAEELLKAERDARGRAETERAAAVAKAADAEALATKLQDDIKNSRAEFQNAFSELSRVALDRASTSFLELATQKFKVTSTEASGQLETRKKEVEALVTPIREKLSELEKVTKELETKREGAYSSLQMRLTELASQTLTLRDSTTALTASLRGSSQARGRWGEVQLKNLVELAGMVNHCDFEEQTGIAEGGRPDLIVQLPGERKIAIDAKAPLSAYLDACAAPDAAARGGFLKLHADSMRNHIKALSARAYWEKLGSGVDFVVMFLPGDSYLSAAFESDGELFENAMKNRVLLATPVTLLALLKTVALYWQQSTVADNAREIAAVSTELYNRVVNFYEPLQTIGKELDGALNAYNKAVGSYQLRILPFARKMEELGVADQARKPLPEISQIDTTTRK